MTRARKVFRSGSTQPLSTSRARAIRVNKLEVGSIVVSVLRQASASSERRNVPIPTVVDEKGIRLAIPAPSL